MHRYFATCLCQKIALDITLPRELSEYSARICDCDFCADHNLAYLSDPKGCIQFDFNATFTHLHQGSEQASFLTCSVCSCIVATQFNQQELRFGALNANLLVKKEMLGTATIVSPKTLSADEKVQRWTSLWCTLVDVNR